MRLGCWRIALPTLLALLGACDEPEADGKADAGDTVDASGPFLPWKEGNTWTYRVTNNGVVSMSRQ